MRSRRQRRAPDPEAREGAPAWTLTYGNLITLLLAFFVMAYAFAGTGIGDAAAGATPATGKSLRVASLSSIKKQIAANAATQHVDGMIQFDSGDNALILHLDAKALYDSGSAEIKSPAALDAVGAVLQNVGNAVRIEGHTDNVPMTPTPQFPDNWALSMARAGGVLRYLHEYYQVAGDRLSAVGYADTHPLASNDTPEGKARNRRVDIVILGR